jgi:AAA+ ATPase superfamily predicted ATPase
MRFVDRKKEMSRLQQLLKANNPSFVIIRGRRRIGKSTLIGKVLNERDIYYEADRTDPINQMAGLSRMVAHIFPGFDDATYRDWRALLLAINHRVSERITVCIDEFPYLVEGSPSLPSVIQSLIDSDTDRLKYNLILCGSSQQMMYNLTHDERSPLYGRTDADFGMKAIPVNYLQEALDLDAQSCIEHYAVWGGVPRYWKLAESSASLRDAIWEHILSDMGALYEEPQRLFRDDMKDIVKTSTIMSVIGSGTNRLSEISSRLGEPATNLSRPLAKLVDLGYLEKEVPFGESAKSSKRGLYRIADPFLHFYNKFVVPNKSFIELGREVPVRMAFERDFSGQVGYWWEHICRDAVSGNVVDGVTYGLCRRWWGKILVKDENGKSEIRDVELDAVAESLDHKTILIGECKWTTGENGRLLTKSIRNIVPYLPFTNGKNVVIKLFTKVCPEEDQGNALLPADVLRML